MTDMIRQVTEYRLSYTPGRHPDTPTPTKPMVRADPPSPPAADIPAVTDVYTPAAPSLVLNLSRRDSPGVTTRNQEWTVKPFDMATVEVKWDSSPVITVCLLNPLTAKLFNLNFHSLEEVLG